MGFKTLAISKQSSEVWKVLGAVKTEFQKFGDVVSKVQKNLETASSNLSTCLIVLVKWKKTQQGICLAKRGGEASFAHGRVEFL